MSKAFWEKEYKNPKFLKMSDEPSEDLMAFAKWAEKNAEWYPFPKGGTVLDIGVGNGRNLLYMAETYSMQGLGIDISGAAITQATNKVASSATRRGGGQKLDVQLSIKSAADPLAYADESVDVVLDMMTSHYLNKKEREDLTKEIVRVLKPYGWLYLKTFFLEDDTHAKELIRDFPAGEAQTYIHPKINVAEFVADEDSIYETYGPYFTIHRILKSHKHVRDGKPYKRRTISVYMEKKPDFKK